MRYKVGAKINKTGVVAMYNYIHKIQESMTSADMSHHDKAM